jgi:hypothetical protein
VPDLSSEFPGAESTVTINANHMNMCRYSSVDDDGYRKVAPRLKLLCRTIQTANETVLRQMAESERAEREKAEQERAEREKEEARGAKEQINSKQCQ